MSETILQVKTREVEKESNSVLREQGFIPAVLYGPGIKNLHLSISDKELDSLLKSGRRTKPFSLKLESGELVKNVLLHSLDQDTLKDKILNVDFYQFDSTKKVKVSLPVVLSGKAPAQELGGVVVLNMNEIEVECLPVNIPDKITVDISVLTDFNSTLYVKNLKLPADVFCHIDPQTAVVSISEPLKEEVLPAAPAATPETPVTEEKQENPVKAG